MATLPADSQARIHAKAQAMIKEIEQDNKIIGDVLVTDFMAQIPPLDIFKDIDPVSYQREIRNEWN